MYSNLLFGVYLKINPLIMFKQTFKYTLLPFLFVMTLFLIAGCGKEETNTNNHLPKADFKVDTYRGDANTVFRFDASLVSDVEDPLELLEVCWDFTNSGVYTEYDTTKIVTYQYTETGLYFPLMKVRDTKGMVDSIKKMVVVVSDLSNLPPYKPEYIAPANWGVYIQPTNIFKWKCSDPEGDSLTFEIWKGTRETNLLFVKSGIKTFDMIGDIMEYNTTMSNLEFNQGYYWKIYARDDAGNYTEGDIWQFTTSPE